MEQEQAEIAWNDHVKKVGVRQLLFRVKKDFITRQMRGEPKCLFCGASMNGGEDHWLDYFERNGHVITSCGACRPFRDQLAAMINDTDFVKVKGFDVEIKSADMRYLKKKGLI